MTVLLHPSSVHQLALDRNSLQPIDHSWIGTLWLAACSWRLSGRSVLLCRRHAPLAADPTNLVVDFEKFRVRNRLKSAVALGVVPRHPWTSQVYRKRNR